VSDNESKIGIEAIEAIKEAIEAVRQRFKDFDAEVEWINADIDIDDPASITKATEAIRQFINDLDTAVQRIRGARRED
jgi:hypothetical protein